MGRRHESASASIQDGCYSDDPATRLHHHRAFRQNELDYRMLPGGEICEGCFRVAGRNMACGGGFATMFRAKERWLWRQPSRNKASGKVLT
jgi:hypothetical protein